MLVSNCWHAESQLFFFGLKLTAFGGAANPTIPVMFSARRTVMLLGLFYSGLLPFVPM